jgi:uncharacterized protein (DUF2235 family)
VKNIVLFFDHKRANSHARTNVRAMFDLVNHATVTQLTWYHSGMGATADGGRTREDIRRNSLADAYLFLVDQYEPGDRIFVFGAGCGAYCARTLTRLLNSAGVLPTGSELLDYALAHWVLPHTHRTPEDWARLARLAAELAGTSGVSVHFLGLWDTVRIPGLPRLSAQLRDTDRLDNVLRGRHAVALDEQRTPAGDYRLSDFAAERIEEVWFRGTHADVIGGSDAQPGLGRITLDWVLDGARRAGVWLRHDIADEMPSPTELDALTTSRQTAATRLLAGVRLPGLSRTAPDGARVHASVEVYLRANPDYWRRLPHHVHWADNGWPARSERLVRASGAPLTRTVGIELGAAS